MDKLEAYLAELKAALASLGENQARDICDEIRGHILDKAEQGGAALDQVLASLGSARDLAASYLQELGRQATAEQGMTPAGAAPDQGADSQQSDPGQAFRRVIDQRLAEALGALGSLGSLGSLGDLGKLGDMGEAFGERMGRWGEEFGKKMEAFGEALGEHMEALGEELGKQPGPWAHGTYTHHQSGDQGCTTLSMEWDAHPDLSIRTWGGPVSVRSCPPGDLRLRAVLRIKNLGLDTIRIEPRDQGGTWLVDLQELQKPGVEIHGVELLVPALVANLTLEQRGGNLAASGLDLERLAIRTWGGNIQVTDCSGSQSLNSCGGNINCTKPVGELDMEADAGNLEISQAGGLGGGRLNTLAGNIRIQGLDGLAAPLELELQTQAGHVVVDGAKQGSRWSGTMGTLEPGARVGRLQAKALTGNIQVD